jgi:mono/diheme cytochrome c family protein
MYKGMLHTHLLSVVLFLVIYLIKTSLLLMNKTTSLQAFTRKVKVPEMIISFLFLGTGIYLLMHTAVVDTFIYLKLAAVALSIPLAIIGFKKGNKMLAVFSLVLLIMAYGLAEMHGKRARAFAPAPAAISSDKGMPGMAIYQQNCTRCHGDKGDAGLSGAADLSTSQNSMAYKMLVVKDGKGGMPAYGTTLSDEQLNAVLAYIETLKKQ